MLFRGASSGKDDLSCYYCSVHILCTCLLVTHLHILQCKRRSWSFEYMHRLLFAGRLGFIQSQVLPLQSKVPSCISSGGCIVRRASMSLYPTLDIKGQTVLITGEQTTPSAQSMSSLGLYARYQLHRTPATCCMLDSACFCDRCEFWHWRGLRLEICRSWMQAYLDCPKNRSFGCIV